MLVEEVQFAGSGLVVYLLKVNKNVTTCYIGTLYNTVHKEESPRGAINTNR